MLLVFYGNYIKKYIFRPREIHLYKRVLKTTYLKNLPKVFEGWVSYLWRFIMKDIPSTIEISSEESIPAPNAHPSTTKPSTKKIEVSLEKMSPRVMIFFFSSIPLHAVVFHMIGFCHLMTCCIFFSCKKSSTLFIFQKKYLMIKSSFFEYQGEMAKWQF